MRYLGGFLFGYTFPRLVRLFFFGAVLLCCLFSWHASQDSDKPSWVSQHGYFGQLDLKLKKLKLRPLIPPARPFALPQIKSVKLRQA